MIPILKENPDIPTRDLARLCCPDVGEARLTTARTHLMGILRRMETYDLVTSRLIADPHGGPGIRLWTYTGESD